MPAALPPPAAALLALALLAVLAPAAAAAPAWRAPVAGPVAARFAVGPDPFAAGQRRGIELAARPGAGVAAPCAGTVRFAGPLPRRGAGVTVRCGALNATVLGLEASSLAVEAGALVSRGERLGRAAGERVRLGARRRGEPFGYVDPEGLLGAGRPSAPVTGAPARRRGPRRPLAPRRGPAPALPLAGAAPAAAPASAGAAVSPAAWAGLALLAIAVPAGALVARRQSLARRGGGARVPSAAR
jgi:hypothetical protein